jgi:NMD protein affecting ribosome stability and mRNA decay
MSTNTIVCPVCGEAFRYYNYSPKTVHGRMCARCWVKSHPAVPLHFPADVCAPEPPAAKEEAHAEE